MIKQLNLGLALAVLAGSAFAQSNAHPGYLTSGGGNVVMSGQGQCVHTGQWTQADAFEPCDPVPHAAAPAPVVVVEEVKEVVVVAPPAPPPARFVTEKVSVTSDVLFRYNKAELTDAGKAALDDIAARIKDASVDGVQIAGYTDRIASVAYNQKLSEQRAQSVQRYLESKGVNARQELVEGKGESSPVTGNECRHMGPESGSNRRLVACLQPDRRVEIEVLGSREVAVQETPAAAGASAQ